MHSFDKNELLELNSRYRATLINSLAGFKTAVLIATENSLGQNNLAIFNSLIHIGANPPIYAFICRPDTVKRDTLTNILETGYYSFNYIKSSEFIKDAAVKIAMKFIEKIDIAINGTIMVLGSVEKIIFEDDLISDDGFVALEKADVLACTGLDAYYKTSFLGRLSYAKTDAEPKRIE